MIESVQKRTVYEDDEIRIIWHPGSTDFILVTFGNAAELANGERFFADVPAGKAGISCIGIMAKNPSWYPEANMLAARPVLVSLLEPYRRRVLHGGSMGGYAAIKYSRLLEATEVLALCPQWSIDPAECEGQCPGWGNHFKPSMAGMGIRPDDVAGAIYVLADRLDQIDHFHSHMISLACPSATIVNVPMVGHHVAFVFAGTQNLLSLLEACRTHDVAKLVQIGRRTRKNTAHQQVNLIRRVMGRRPQKLLEILLRQPPDNLKAQKLGTEFLFFAVDWLIGKGEGQDAVDYIKRFGGAHRDPWAQIMIAGFLSKISGMQACIKTFHDTVLVYDVGQDRCVNRKYESGRLQTQVKLHIKGNYASLFIELGGMRIDLFLDKNGYLVTRPDDAVPASPAQFAMTPFKDGLFSLLGSKKYVSAEPNGMVICNRESASDWESFSIRPV